MRTTAVQTENAWGSSRPAQSLSEMAAVQLWEGASTSSPEPELDCTGILCVPRCAENQILEAEGCCKLEASPGSTLRAH